MKTVLQKNLNWFEKSSVMIPENGNIPAEHYEARCGEHLVDTISTANRALPGFRLLSPADAKYAAAYEKLRNLIVEIQNLFSEPQFNGCTYGMEQRFQYGGDRLKAVQEVICTGWTKCPISWAMDILKTRPVFIK